MAATTKISALTALASTIAGTDLLVIVDDPSGSAVTKKLEVEDFLTYLPAAVGAITLATSSNGDINLSPNGTGSVIVTSSDVVITGNNSDSAWTTNGIQLALAAATHTDTSTAGSGTSASATFLSVGTPTLAATNTSVTTTDAASVYIAAAPAAGTNQTITNAYALWIDDGNVRIDGSVSVGADPPDTNFQVYESNTDTTPALKVEQGSTGDAALTFLLTGGQQFVVGIDNSTTNDDFVITDGSALGTAAMRIDGSSSNIGFGPAENAVDTNVHVEESNTDTTAAILIEQGSTGDAGISFLLSGGQQFVVGIDNSTTNDDFVITDGASLGAARMRIDGSSGNIGFGPAENAVDTNVHIEESNTDTAAAILVEQGSTGDSAISFLLSGGQQWMLGIDNSATNDDFCIADGAALGSTNRLVIDGSSGDVAIGVDSPDSRLHVYDGSAGAVAASSNSVLTVESNSHATIGFLSPDAFLSLIEFGSASDNDYISVSGSYNSGSPYFQVGALGAVQFRTQNGNFLIGTTTSTSAGGGKVLIFGDNAAQPTLGSDTAGLYGYDSGTTTVEMYAVDEAGNDSILSPHAKDGPPGIYNETPGKESVVGYFNKYRAEVRWVNLEDPAKPRIVETFLEYNTRRGLSSGDRGFRVSEDWEAVQDLNQQSYDRDLRTYKISEATDRRRMAGEWKKIAASPRWKRNGFRVPAPGKIIDKPKDFVRKAKPAFLE